MITVGIRELKAHLSRFLREVQDGETIQVTDRGRVVAELKRPEPGAASANEVDRALARLAATGDLRLAERPKYRYPISPIALPAGTAQELLDESREDRF